MVYSGFAAVFILEDALSVWTNLGKHLLVVFSCVSSIKTGTGRIMHLDELSSVVRRSRRTTDDSSFRRIMRPMTVFKPGTHDKTSNKCSPKFVQTDNASSSIKTANDSFRLINKGLIIYLEPGNNRVKPKLFLNVGFVLRVSDSNKKRVRRFLSSNYVIWNK